MAKVLGIFLIVVGALALVFGSFSFTKDSHDVKLGPIELSVKEKQTVSVPLWAGIAAIVVGAVLVVVGSKR